MEYLELKKELSKGQKKNLYILVGQERDLIQIYIKRIAETVVPVTSTEHLAQLCTSRGLFQINKTYIMDNNEKAAEMKFDALNKLIKNNTLIMVFDTIDTRKKFFKDAKDHIYEFVKQEPATIAKYIQSLVNIKYDLAMMIATRCNNSITKASMEVDKLIMMKTEITEELINELITPSPEDFVFELIDCIISGKVELAYSIYDDLKALKESPIKLISLLYNAIRNILHVYAYANLEHRDIGAKTGLMFWQVKNALNLMNYRNSQQLTRMLMKVQKAEMDMKTGKADPEMAFEMLLIEIFSM